MGERDVGVIEPGAGVDPESFRFPENHDSKTPGKEFDPAELKEILELLDSKDPDASAVAEARIKALGFPDKVVFREFNFYQDRFQGMADRHNQRKGWERFVDKRMLVNDKPSRP